MTTILRQSTASQDIAIGPFIDDADFKTAETALTIANTDIKLMKDGGASANKNSGGGTHRVNGVYTITLDATDTATVGDLFISVVVSGALPVFHRCYVMEEAAYDILYGSGAAGVVPTVTTLTGHTAQTGDNYARLGAPAGASVSADIAAVKTDTADILTDTGTTIPAQITALNDPTAAAIADAVWDEATSGHVTAGSTGVALTDILADTADMQPKLGTPAGADMSADIAAVKSDTAAILVDTAEIGTAGAGLTDLGGRTLDSGTAQAGSSTSITLQSGAVATDDYYNGSIVVITGGTGVGQSQIITDYVGSTKVATTGTWATAPDATSTYQVLPLGLVALSAADVNAEVDTALTDIGLDHLVAASVAGTDITDNSIFAKLVSASATADWDDFVNTTDSLQAIRDRGDSAWTTGAGGSNPFVLQNTTIATLASQTSFTLTAGSADNDTYNNMLIVVTDSATSTQKAVGVISDYVGSTKTVTLREDPAIFTMAVGDTVDVLAISKDVADIIVDTVDIQSRLPAALVGGKMDSDATAISGDTTAADNLELMFDGTGYTDDTAPASRSQIDGIGAASGGSLNFPNEQDNIDGAIKSITFVGTETSGTNASVDQEDGTYHQITHATNNIDIVYQFDVGGGRTAVEATWKGYLDGSNDVVAISVYNYTGAAWETVTTHSGKAGSTNDVVTVPLYSRNTGTGADLGKALVRFTCTSQSSPILYTDQLYVSAVNIGQSVGYSDGAIWVNTNASNTNTEAFVDGTADNPVSTWAAALTLSAALGIDRFHVAGGSSITLTANSDSYQIIGDGLFTLALGGQSIANAYIKLGNISGTSSGSGAVIEDSRINDSTSMGPGYFVRCGFDVPSGAAFTANGAGEYAFVDCVSLVAANAQPYFDFSGTGGTTSIDFRRWSGGHYMTLDSNCSSSLDVVAGGSVTLVTGGADAAVRGITRAFTATVSGSETVQFSGITGHIVLNGTAVAATVNLSGTASDVTDNTTNCTVDDDTISLPNINTQADTAISDASLATAAALATVDGIVDSILTDTGTTIPAQITALNDPTAAAIADAVWDEATSGHVTAGTFGKLLADVLEDTGTTLPALIAALNDVSTADILAAGDVDGFSVEETLKLILATAVGKLSGAATTTVTIRAADDSTDRVVATVDADGNRSAVTLTETG